MVVVMVVVVAVMVVSDAGGGGGGNGGVYDLRHAGKVGGQCGGARAILTRAMMKKTINKK
jgi:hypothetical protein